MTGREVAWGLKIAEIEANGKMGPKATRQERRNEADEIRTEQQLQQRMRRKEGQRGWWRRKRGRDGERDACGTRATVEQMSWPAVLTEGERAKAIVPPLAVSVWRTLRLRPLGSASSTNAMPPNMAIARSVLACHLTRWSQAEKRGRETKG